MTRNLKRKYDLIIDDLSRDIDDRYKEYLRTDPRLFTLDNLIFDVTNLDRYYQCEGCKTRKRKAFCCMNHDLELTASDLERLNRVLPEVLKLYPELKRTLGDEGLYKWGDSFEKIMRQKRSGECLFLMPGAKGCYLHGYALHEGLSPLKVKPYICSLYPVVVLVIDEDVVITTVNPDSEKILDCGGEATSCLTKRGKASDHVLVRSREILVNMFGKKAIAQLEARIKSR